MAVLEITNFTSGTKDVNDLTISVDVGTTGAAAIALGWERDTISSATIDGQTATVVQNQQAGIIGSAVLWADSLSSGTVDVVITFSGTTYTFYGGTSYSLDGFDMTANDSGGAGASSTTVSTTVDVAQDGAVVAASYLRGGGTATWTGVTEDYENNGGLNGRSVSTGSEDALSSETGRTIQNIWSASQHASLAVVSFAPASSGATDVAASAASLSVTEGAATVDLDVSVSSSASSLSMSGLAADIAISSDTVVDAVTASLGFTVRQATTALDVETSATTAQLAISPLSSVVGSVFEVTAQQDALTLSAVPASITRAFDIQSAAAGLTIGEMGASISFDVAVQANTASLGITGNAATVDLSADVTVNAGATGLSIGPANPSVNFDLLAGTFALSLTGGIAGIDLGIKNVSCSLVSRAGASLPGLVNLSWAWFDQSDPALFAAPTDQGDVEVTDGGGLLEVDIPNSALSVGQTGTLILRSDDGSSLGAYNLQVS